MAKIFNRAIDETHVYFGSLQTLAASPERTSKALATNLEFDDRVSPERDNISFRDTFSSAAGNLEKAVRVHHETLIQRAELPEFADPTMNGTNAVLSNRHDDTLFVTILDLNGLVEVYDWDRGLPSPILPRNVRQSGNEFGTPNNQSDVGSWAIWLDDQLNEKSEAERSDFVGQILQVVGKLCKSGIWHHPTWVTPWEKFKPYFRESVSDQLLPNRWVQVLGLPKQPDRWLAAVSYSFADLGRTLFRPSQLDAGAWAWFVPSPPWLDVQEGGRAMELRVSSDYHEPLPEFIHAQLTHLHAGNVLGVAKMSEPTAGVDLDDCRRQHRKRLDGAGADPAWLPM